MPNLLIRISITWENEYTWVDRTKRHQPRIPLLYIQVLQGYSTEAVSSWIFQYCFSSSPRTELHNESAAVQMWMLQRRVLQWQSPEIWKGIPLTLSALGIPELLLALWMNHCVDFLKAHLVDSTQCGKLPSPLVLREPHSPELGEVGPVLEIF